MNVTASIEDLRLLSQMAEEVIADQERYIELCIGCVPFSLKIRTEAGCEGLSAAVSWLANTTAYLERFKTNGTWGISIEGFMKNNGRIYSLLSLLQLYLSAYEVEFYEDEQHLYASYYCGVLNSSIGMVGDEEVNLQVYADYSPRLGRWKVALRTPNATPYGS
jgi:hypothetical protein